MSLASALNRVCELQGLLGAPGSAPVPAAASASTPSAFVTALRAADPAATMAAPGAAATTATPALSTPGLAAPGSVTATPGLASEGGTNAGRAALAAAQGEVGQAEQPPGSNDSVRIAGYRRATAGSGVGPWCAYFVSWAARQAGAPLGDQGQGYGAVADVWAWGQRTGRALPAGTRPQPGDLIVWGSRHIGIVESVDAGGAIHTIEGNSTDRVSRRTYGADGGGATGYVRLG